MIGRKSFKIKMSLSLFTKYLHMYFCFDRFKAREEIIFAYISSSLHWKVSFYYFFFLLFLCNFLTIDMIVKCFFFFIFYFGTFFYFSPSSSRSWYSFIFRYFCFFSFVHCSWLAFGAGGPTYKFPTKQRGQIEGCVRVRDKWTRSRVVMVLVVVGSAHLSRV